MTLEKLTKACRPRHLTLFLAMGYDVEIDHTRVGTLIGDKALSESTFLTFSTPTEWTIANKPPPQQVLFPHSLKRPQHVPSIWVLSRTEAVCLRLYGCMDSVCILRSVLMTLRRRIAVGGMYFSVELHINGTGTPAYMRLLTRLFQTSQTCMRCNSQALELDMCSTPAMLAW